MGKSMNTLGATMSKRTAAKAYCLIDTTGNPVFGLYATWSDAYNVTQCDPRYKGYTVKQVKF